MRQLASKLELKTYATDERVFSQGDLGDMFYIIQTGVVIVNIDDKNIRSQMAGDYFGERALLSDERRSATIVCSEECEIWSMSKADFRATMDGPIMDYLKARIA